MVSSIISYSLRSKSSNFLFHVFTSSSSCWLWWIHCYSPFPLYPYLAVRHPSRGQVMQGVVDRWPGPRRSSRISWTTLERWISAATKVGKTGKTGKTWAGSLVKSAFVGMFNRNLFENYITMFHCAFCSSPEISAMSCCLYSCPLSCNFSLILGYSDFFSSRLSEVLGIPNQPGFAHQESPWGQSFRFSSLDYQRVIHSPD